MDYDLKKLNQMVTIAKVGSFSKASEILHITQPALSRSIAALEKQFGIKIFQRGRKGAVLTLAGEFAVREAEEILHKVGMLEHNLRQIGKGDAGKISFGMGPLLGSLILPRLSSEFLCERPKLKIRTSIKAADHLLQELYDKKIEMLFCGDLPFVTEDDIASEIIGRLRIAKIVRKEHPLATKKNVYIDELMEFPYLSGMELPAPHWSIGEFICDNYHVLRETTLASDGVWITSPQLVKKDLDEGRLIVLNIKDQSSLTHTNISILSLRGYNPSPAATLVTKYIKNFFLI